MCWGLRGKGLLVVDLPKQEQRHAGLAKCGLCRAEVGVGAEPAGKVSVNSSHASSRADGARAILLLILNTAAPGGDVHRGMWLPAPVHEGTAAGGGKWGLDYAIPSEVPHDLGEGPDTGGEGSTGCVGEWLTGDAFEELHQLLGCGTCGRGAGGGVTVQEGNEACAQPSASMIAVWWGLWGRRGGRDQGLSRGCPPLRLMVSQCSRAELALQGQRAGCAKCRLGRGCIAGGRGGNDGLPPAETFCRSSG